MISNKSKISKNENVVSKRIDDEYLLIPIVNEVADTNNIFGINEVGAYIWDNLNDQSISELIQKVMNEFDVSEEIAKIDIEEFITECSENNLLKINYV